MQDEERRDDAPPRGWKRLLLRRALALRCPQCGRGALFAGYARMRDECAECGLAYRRQHGTMTGSMYLSAAVTEVFAVVVLVVLWLWTDVSTPVGLAVGLPLVGAFAYGFLPWSKSIWTAVEYGTDVHNGEPWARIR